MRKTLMIAMAAALLGAGSAWADAIPYPDSGSYNATTYSFKATTSGDLIGYIVGGFGAGDDNEVGVLDNGVLTSNGFGLDNHSSSQGQSFDFGAVTAGDVLTFVLQNNTLGKDAYSNPALNVAYDDPGETIGHNHIYSTAYSGTQFSGVPAGTYVAFEDLPFPNSDFNYNDESFVFTGTAIASAAPEPSSWALMIFGVGMIGATLRFGRGRKAAIAA